jgi:hypothetical protein
MVNGSAVPSGWRTQVFPMSVRADPVCLRAPTVRRRLAAISGGVLQTGGLGRVDVGFGWPSRAAAEYLWPLVVVAAAADGGSHPSHHRQQQADDEEDDPEDQNNMGEGEGSDEAREEEPEDDKDDSENDHDVYPVCVDVWDDDCPGQCLKVSFSVAPGRFGVAPA